MDLHLRRVYVSRSTGETARTVFGVVFRAIRGILRGQPDLLWTEVWIA